MSSATGLGDLCFGRITREARCKGFGRAGEWTDNDFLEGSNNTKFQELGSFQRQGLFPFFKLPLEIRQRILKMLIKPFYTTSMNGQAHCTLSISAKKTWDPDYDKTFEEYYAKKTMGAEENHQDNAEPYIISPEERKKEEIKWNQAKKDLMHETKLHPSRTRQYEVSAHAAKYGQRSRGQNEDWPMIHLIRNLSHAGPQFRQELGDVFFQRTEISVSEVASTSWELQAFLEERPGIHNGVKKLSLGLNLETDSGQNLLKENPAEFNRTLQYVSQALRLESLQLTLYICDFDLPAVAQETSWLSFLPAATRSLNVTHGFDCYVEIIPDGTFGDDMDAEEDYCEELERKWGPKIRDHLLPDTLRPTQSKTEAEMYLLSRPSTTRHIPAE